MSRSASAIGAKWPAVSVGELAKSISDTHKFNKPDLIFLNTSDVLLGKILHHSYSAVKDWPGQAKKSIRKGDILFSEIRPANGRYAFVDVDAADFVVSTKLMVIRVDDGRISPRFLYHFLTSSDTLAWLQHLAESRSGTFPQITFDQVAELEFPLPPQSQQAAIVEFLDAIEAKTDLNRRMNETLETTARAIFKSWFVDFDPVRAKADGRKPSGLDAATAALFPDTFQKSALGPIPKGWSAGCLGDAADNPRRGVSPNEIEAGTAYIALEHMPRRCIALDQWGDASEVASGKFRFNKGEILFGKLRTYFHKVGVALIGGVCSTDILVVVPKKPDWFGFVLGHVSSDEFVAHTDSFSAGTKMPRANWADMARYAVVLPPVNLAAGFTSQVAPMVGKIGANIMESRTLAAIRDALLPKLLSGEIRVTDAEKVVHHG